MKSEGLNRKEQPLQAIELTRPEYPDLSEFEASDCLILSLLEPEVRQVQRTREKDICQRYEC